MARLAVVAPSLSPRPGPADVPTGLRLAAGAHFTRSADMHPGGSVRDRKLLRCSEGPPSGLTAGQALDRGVNGFKNQKAQKLFFYGLGGWAVGQGCQRSFFPEVDPVCQNMARHFPL